MSNSLNIKLYSDPSEYLPTLSLSRKKFQEIVDSLKPQDDKMQEKVSGMELVAIMSLRISNEIFGKSF
jgi:hypothetical protein